MINDRNNTAYDFGVFEERKVQRQKKVIKFPHKRQKKKVELRAKIALIGSLTAVFLITVLTCTFFIYGQVVLTELTAKNEVVSKQLAQSQSIYTQLKMKKDSANSLNSTHKAKEDNNRGTLEKEFEKENLAPQNDLVQIK